jgi:hypothetical protein
MIRTLALAAAAAAVGYVAGQRAAESPESRFSQPEETGDDPSVDPDDVVFEDGEVTLADDARRHKSSDIENPYGDWERFGDADGRIGR